MDGSGLRLKRDESVGCRDRTSRVLEYFSRLGKVFTSNLKPEAAINACVIGSFMIGKWVNLMLKLVRPDVQVSQDSKTSIHQSGH